MSQQWATRQRGTNRLVRLITAFVCRQKTISTAQLYGLIKLTWITKSYDLEHRTYINSTKIPALGDIFHCNFEGVPIEDVALHIARTTNNKAAQDLVLQHSGFTNIRASYRNSCLDWIDRHRIKLEQLVRDKLSNSNEIGNARIIEEIEKLPRIQIANDGNKYMRAEFLLTPLFFAIDRRVRFPIINGDKGVVALLQSLRVHRSPLIEQFRALQNLIGTEGIEDAADLDQAGPDLADFVDTDKSRATKRLLRYRSDNESLLPLKDEEDIQVLLKSRTIKFRRRHNQLTNRLWECLAAFTLIEGKGDAAYDVIVKKYDSTKKDDLLIEVKSSTDFAQIRMAIGQLFSYWHCLQRAEQTPHHLAVLTPEELPHQTQQLLTWLKIGSLWFEDGKLATKTESLLYLVSNSH